MTIRGDLEALLKPRLRDAMEAASTAHHVFDFLACADVISFLEGRGHDVVAYCNAIDDLRQKVICG